MTETVTNVLIDGGAFKRTMRQLASGVFVITTRLDARPHATTATAFLPLSAEPPLALICAHTESDTHRALIQGARFGVSVLSSSQAALSTRFAGKTSERYRFADVPQFEGPHGCLLFRSSTAHIEVELESTAAGGDHTIFIGRVLWLQADPKQAPLVYHQGGHHLLRPLEDFDASPRALAAR
jgi:flavin reductase (DIM6/NTAB) family NADH-FMN oxidoreductase RutF